MGSVHHRAGDRGAQPGRGQPGRPVQHLILGGGGLGRIEQAGGAGDDLGLGHAQGAVIQGGPRAGQVGVQVAGCSQQRMRAGAGLAQRASQLVGGEFLVQRTGVTPAQLRDRGELAGGGVRFDAVPGAQHADQLGLRDAGEAVLRRGLGGDRQACAARQDVQGQSGPERGRRAGRLAGEDPRRARLARAAPPGGGRFHGQQLVGGGLADLRQFLRREGAKSSRIFADRVRDSNKETSECCVTRGPVEG